jgi:hypothetical protein
MRSNSRCEDSPSKSPPWGACWGKSTRGRRTIAVLKKTAASRLLLKGRRRRSMKGGVKGNRNTGAEKGFCLGDFHRK